MVTFIMTKEKILHKTKSFRNNYYITKVPRNKYYEGTNSTWHTN